MIQYMHMSYAELQFINFNFHCVPFQLLMPTQFTRAVERVHLNFLVQQLLFSLYGCSSFFFTEVLMFTKAILVNKIEFIF